LLLLVPLVPLLAAQLQQAQLVSTAAAIRDAAAGQVRSCIVLAITAAAPNAGSLLLMLSLWLLRLHARAQHAAKWLLGTAGVAGKQPAELWLRSCCPSCRPGPTVSPAVSPTVAPLAAPREQRVEQLLQGRHQGTQALAVAAAAAPCGAGLAPCSIHQRPVQQLQL
jgi:hypothetical protein